MVDGVFFIIEGIRFFIIAWEYFHKGKKALPWSWGVIGIFQVVMAFVTSRKGLAHHKAVRAE